MKYLGFWVTRDDIKTINIKTEAITNMKPPTYLKEVQKFIGVMNCYRNMWPTLTRITSIKHKFKWTQVEQDAFNKIKRIVASDNLLTYLGFNETFKTYTNARKF